MDQPLRREGGIRTVESLELKEGMPELEPVMENLSRDIVKALEAFEEAQRNYFPGIVPRLRENFQPLLQKLCESKADLANRPAPDQEILTAVLTDAATLCLDALQVSTDADWVEQALINFRKAGRKIHRALEMLYPLCRLLPPINLFFLEKAARNRAGKFVREAGTDPPVAGLVHMGVDGHLYARGGSTLYIPECRDDSKPLPLVVALHGGFSHGRDFIWTWLREARSRSFILAAPSSRGITWTITGHDFDVLLLHDLLDYINGRWKVDPSRMLLTGFSDGGTYALVRALDEESPFSAYAVVSGILPPFDLQHVKGRRVCWVHGARDWMFPPWQAKVGAKQLADAGADITQKIVPDLYHAYPREENGGILTWFDPSLALTV